MTFTCTAAVAVPSTSGDDQSSTSARQCGHRSTHEFSRHSYEKGIVLVQCPACSVRHLIADHLDWFDAADLTQGGKMRTVEDLLRAKGERVRRGSVSESEGETIEVSGEETLQR